MPHNADPSKHALCGMDVWVMRIVDDSREPDDVNGFQQFGFLFWLYQVDTLYRSLSVGRSACLPNVCGVW